MSVNDKMNAFIVGAKSQTSQFILVKSRPARCVRYHLVFSKRLHCEDLRIVVSESAAVSAVEYLPPWHRLLSALFGRHESGFKIHWYVLPMVGPLKQSVVAATPFLKKCARQCHSAIHSVQRERRAFQFHILPSTRVLPNSSQPSTQILSKILPNFVPSNFGTNLCNSLRTLPKLRTSKWPHPHKIMDCIAAI